MKYQLDSLGEWLDGYEFEALITIRLPPNLPIFEVHKHYISDVIRPLGKYNHTKIGAYTIISPATGTSQAHLHSLIVSKHNNLSKKIDESNAHIHTLKTKLNTHELAIHIQLLNYQGGVAQYVANHLKPQAEFFYYNKWLVSEKKKKVE